MSDLLESASSTSRKRQTVVKLLEAVQTLKQEVDARSRAVLALRSTLEQFEAQYDAYIQTLQRQRQDLAQRVQYCRLRIQDWGKEQEPQQPQQIQQEPPPKPEPPPQEPAETPPMVEEIEPSDNTVEQERKQTRNFFAQFWHPDASKQWTDACPDPYLMYQVNFAFEQTHDLVDLLIAIPWHDAWLSRGKGETTGMQWERLTDWQEALEQAPGRLDQAMADLQQHEFYPLLLEKQVADERGEDYFAQLAARERDEISRLEKALATLQSELDELERHKPEEQDA